MNYSNNNWGQPQFNQFGQRQDNNIMCVLVPNSTNFDNVAVMPNQKVFVMSQTEPLFAMKAADGMGFITTKYCRFEEFDPRESAQQQQMSIEQRLSRLEGIINEKSINEYAGRYAEEPTGQQA